MGASCHITCTPSGIATLPQRTEVPDGPASIPVREGMCAPTPMTQSFPEDAGSAHRAGHLAIIYSQTGSPSLQRARPGACRGMLGLAHASRQACRGQRRPPPPLPPLWPLQPPGEPGGTVPADTLRRTAASGCKEVRWNKRQLAVRGAPERPTSGWCRRNAGCSRDDKHTLNPPGRSAVHYLETTASCEQTSAGWGLGSQ